MGQADIRRHSLFCPDCTVGPGISPDLLTPSWEGRSRAPRSCRDTAGGELHPAPRLWGDHTISPRDLGFERLARSTMRAWNSW